MDALQYLTFLILSTDEFPGFRQVDHPMAPVKNPRYSGALGKTWTERHTQPVMIDGTRFIVTVEKDPNQ